MHVFLSPRPALTPWLDFIVLGFICLPTLQVFPCGAQASEGVPKRILLGGGMDWEFDFSNFSFFSIGGRNIDLNYYGYITTC